MTLEMLAQVILEDMMDYYAHETDEWSDPTADKALYLVEAQEKHSLK